jgi:hypothetical protein
VSETAKSSVAALPGSIVAGDHAEVEATPRDIARDVILKQIGAARVAAWCGVPANTVYQWLKRGSDVEPIPLLSAMVIFDQARKAGIHFDIRSIAPAVPAGRV